MNELEFEDWCREQQLATHTIDLIALLRKSPPSRRVQGRTKNVCGVYPSSKMGVTIQFESHTVELWAIYLMEHDPQVLEFYDQPPPFKIQYKNQVGRNIGHYHTPDFFVLRHDGACWEEWKTVKELEFLAQKYPGRYQKTASGHWRCPPGEAHASQFGLKYCVRTDAELNPVFTQNLMFLSDYLGFKSNLTTDVHSTVLAYLEANPGITIAALLQELNDVCANDIYIMIATELLYVDLSAVPLVEHYRTRLWASQQTHDAYTHASVVGVTTNNAPNSPTTLLPNTALMWDAALWTLVNYGETTTTLLPESGFPIQLPTAFFLQLFDSGTIKIHDSVTKDVTINETVRTLMETASPVHLKEANRKFNIVQAYLQRHTDIYQDINPRTLRRWVQQFREAEASYGCGYVGLLPRTHQQGNRQPKSPTDSSELLDKFIKEHFETPRQATGASVYRAYVRACTALNIQPLSNRTFYQRLKKRPTHEQTLKRQGAKAAYATEPFVWELALNTRPHGNRPLEIVHIDHTELDIELRSQATGRLLGRPWLTLLTDAYSRRILAVYLTFDAPSYRSCMMGLRILVQRQGRFPSTLVVDGGKEFHSIYFDTLLARYHCTKKTRPGGKPRFGSVIERLFGTTNTEFIYNLLGNTQASKQPRQLTKTVDPKQLAVWNLGDLYTYLTQWAYSIYDSNHHDSLGASCGVVYNEGLSIAGERLHRSIAYNEEFLMATRPSTPKGQAKVQPGYGIKVNYLYYWSDAFRNPNVEKTLVPVRYDPFDMGVAYAYVDGRWVRCISQYYSTFVGRTEKEVLLAAQEIRQLNKRSATAKNLNAKHLADFIANVQEHEALLLQRLRDLESKRLLDNLTSSNFSVPSVNQVQSTFAVLAQQSEDVASHAPSRNVEPLDLNSLPILAEYK
ncbi:TnsA endonuclease N-terminal domain-containing protein [Nostoc sp. 2RC]|uniref:TnsA endonuclease N-terminal domain-containing protein n=1 Tax=Nostoc sp. 2RC TaxID=2485484 RepID=UPI001624FF44|nr:TnsA endonuclease N-terminal domain-containing protein [Nostoc sp. 2RC]MBC1237220.1 DDE-type integrase/transposase/recombinase [Nostoc sp. 2RC]